MLLPRAEFWRLWGCALLLAAAAILSLSAMQGAHGATLRASFYDQGTRTASGAPFRPMGLSAAHRSWPFGTRLRVCLVGCVVVTVNDRGPFVRSRDLDLSRGAARAIGLEARGIAAVTVERLD